MYDCTFTNNNASATGDVGATTNTAINVYSYGGGIYTRFETVYIYNTTITSSSVSASGAEVGGNLYDQEAYGGGIYTTAPNSLMINNCTITGNSAGNYGGGLFCDSSTSHATLVDTILWSNTAATTGNEIYLNSTCTVLLFNSDYANATGDVVLGSGTIATTACISLDPLFVVGPGGNYYLSQVAAGQLVDSPCLDAGSDTAVNLGLDTKTTRTDAVVDAGLVDIGYHYKP